MDIEIWIFLGTAAMAWMGYLWRRMARCLVRTDYYPASVDGPKAITVVVSWGGKPLRDVHVFVHSADRDLAMQPVIGILPPGDSINVGLKPATLGVVRSYAVYRTALPWLWMERDDRDRRRLRHLGAHPDLEDAAPSEGRTYLSAQAELAQRGL
ncbi:MAG: hypothetical protein JHC95_04650 [Solirubrobacteraceae bacterium]|nr:hypothetical protein [Solirubrobacteraceae bacterium]